MKKKTSYIIIILTALVSVVSSILINYATSVPLPPSIQLYLPWAWPLVGIMFVGGIVLAIWQEKSDRILYEPSKTNRKLILERVQDSWIKGVLDMSLQGVVNLTLRLSEQSKALADPWRFVQQKPGQAAQELPIGTDIVQIYDEAEGELLILGGPGSGKTTILLELARKLLVRASESDSHPIPLVFNLSTWAIRRKTLEHWLIEELEINYGVSPQLGKFWVNGDKILLLLDGLDEVDSAYFDDCITTINDYRHRHASVPIVVCSRVENYFRQTKRLLLNRAIAIKPFTSQQIDTYLSSGGEKLAALRQALKVDADLRMLARVPLMLNILTLAYQGVSLEDVLELNPLTTRQKQVFTNYTNRMLQRRKKTNRYTPEKMVHYLSWLAGQLKQRDLTVFLTSWTEDFVIFLDARSRHIYHKVLFRAIGLAIGGCVFGLFFGWLGVVVGGLCGGLVIKQFDKLLLRPILKRISKWSFVSSIYTGEAETEEVISYSTIAFFGCLFPPIILLLMLLNLLFSHIGIGFFSRFIEFFSVILTACSLVFIIYSILRMFIPKVLLWHAGSIPWNYINFLNQAVDCLLLLKAGRRYIFIHQLFLTYFAGLEDIDRTSSKQLGELTAEEQQFPNPN